MTNKEVPKYALLPSPEKSNRENWD